MGQRGFAGLFIFATLFVFVSLFVSAYYLSGKVNFLPDRQSANNPDSDVFDLSNKDASISAEKEQTVFFPVEVTNKQEKEHWEKVYAGEAVHDISAFTSFHPNTASSSAKKKYHNALLAVADLIPKPATPEAYMKTAFYVDHYKMTSPKDNSGKTHGNVYLEYFERSDYPVDVLLAYEAKIFGLNPNSEYQILLCKYSIDCFAETSTNPAETDKNQERYFKTDDKGGAKVKGMFPLGNMADRMIVARHNALYDNNSVECGSIKNPCMVAGLPKALLTFPQSEEGDRNFYAQSYKNTDNLKQAIKNKYLSYYKDLDYKEGVYDRPIYSRNDNKGILVTEGTKKVEVFEVTSCEAGLTIFVDKIFGDQLGFKFIKC